MSDLAIVLPVGIGNAKRMGEAARRAEELGYSGVYAPESLAATPDSLAVALTAAMSTSRVEVGTAITNIYLRHPALAARAVSFINDVSGGRMVLGLGVAHRTNTEPLGIEMRPPIPAMREYVAAMRPYLTGGPPPRVYLAALRDGMARLSGEIADGVMLNMVPLRRFARSVAAVREGERRRSVGSGPPKGTGPAGAVRESPARATGRITSLLGISVSDDLAAARQQGRLSIAFYLRRENYRALLAESGYAEVVERARVAAEAGEWRKVAEAVSDELVDQVWLCGPARRCRELIDEYRAAGLELPILSPRGGEEGFRVVLEAMGRNP